MFGFTYKSVAQTNTVSDTTKSILVVSEKLDTSKKAYPYPPRAALFSAVLPGLGQAYNKNYWKIPVIYAGLATIGYFTYKFDTTFKSYKQGYITAIDTIKGNEKFPAIYSSDNLYSQQDAYHRKRDLMIVAGVAIYVANIVDAMVSAHLYHFDVSDNLSLQVQPHLNYNWIQKTYQPSLGVCINFK